ncbi:MAG: HU family DNA-binding protein [Bacteroidales bacterium]|jgi:DNA-binding protein HU-beta|nr:HU family DNA-binding protein [Bacteroidales bacterium]
MTHKELITELSDRLGWSSARTSLVLESAIGIISENLADSSSVNIQGFGVFETKLRQERVSVNPLSQQRFLVPPKITPAFRPGQTLKEKLKNS